MFTCLFRLRKFAGSKNSSATCRNPLVRKCLRHLFLSRAHNTCKSLYSIWPKHGKHSYGLDQWNAALKTEQFALHVCECLLRVSFGSTIRAARNMLEHRNGGPCCQGHATFADFFVLRVCFFWFTQIRSKPHLAGYNFCSLNVFVSPCRVQFLNGTIIKFRLHSLQARTNCCSSRT